MIEYKELHLLPHGDLFVRVEEVERFVPYIKKIKAPSKYNWTEDDNIVGYYISAPFYHELRYATIFEMILKEGWKYYSTYFVNDHKVMTFLKEN